MAIKWTSDLTVGIEAIDDQHKILFENVNKLFEACNLGQGKNLIGDMLVFLSNYTKKHFSDEEKYMLRINYPGYDKQCASHKGFITELENIMKEYAETGSNLMITLKINNLVVKWLTNHISIDDKKIGEFAKK